MNGDTGNIPADQLPGDFKKRVFIGGNYNNMATLRSIRDIVSEEGYETVLPFDDFEFPTEETYDWSMRLLHQCKYAIFDITNPGGQLLELVRARDYQTDTLLISQTTDPFSEVDEKNIIGTMIRQSGHPIRTYSNMGEFRETALNFLESESSRKVFQVAEEARGFIIDVEKTRYDIKPNGDVQHKSRFEGITVTDDRSIYQIPHDLWFDGKIVDFEFNSLTDHTLSWESDPSVEDSDKVERGFVQIENGFERGQAPISYEFSLEIESGFATNQEELEALEIEGDKLVSEGREYISKDILYPTNRLKMEVAGFEGYIIDPKPSIYTGGISDTRDNLERNMETDSNYVELFARRPKVFREYRLSWKLPN